MVLTDSELVKAISSKEILIVPFEDEYVRPSSYCLTLGEFIFSVLPQTTAVSLQDKTTYPKHHKHHISNSNPYVLEAGEFVLANTKESIALTKSYTGHLSNISGLARLGVDALLSTHIAPGYGENQLRPITLEIKNHSNIPLKLTPGIRIAHLILLKASKQCETSYDELFPGKYLKGVSSEYFEN